MKGIKKNRGLRRYYKNLEANIDFEKSTRKEDFNDLNGCCNNGHWHFDRKGYGNDSFKRRKAHLDKLFRHFDFLVYKTKQLNTDFQLYSILLDFDSCSDALFLNRPNAIYSQFPFKISDLKLTTTLTNGQLNDYINNLDGYQKLYGQADEAFCLIFKKNVGLPF